MSNIDKFWQWIEEKGYIFNLDDYEKLPYIECEVIKMPCSYSAKIELPKQMIIGYMIEYLIKNEAEFRVTYFESYSIDNVYDYLEDKINE